MGVICKSSRVVQASLHECCAELPRESPKRCSEDSVHREHHAVELSSTTELSEVEQAVARTSDEEKQSLAVRPREPPVLRDG